MGERKKLQIYDCDYVMNTQMVQTPYIIEKMIYQGLYILAGAPKMGKSWFALELCLSVAEGRQFLKHETNCGEALYLSLEIVCCDCKTVYTNLLMRLLIISVLR